MSKRITVLMPRILFAAFATIGAANSDAQTTGGGGCVGCSPETELIGAALEESFASTTTELLLRQSWASSICENHPCSSGFGVLGEDEARDLLQSYLASRQRNEDRRLTLINTGIAGFAAVLSLVALWQTYLTSREARFASERSIRNEARIEQISEKI